MIPTTMIQAIVTLILVLLTLPSVLCPTTHAPLVVVVENATAPQLQSTTAAFEPDAALDNNKTATTFFVFPFYAGRQDHHDEHPAAVIAPAATIMLDVCLYVSDTFPAVDVTPAHCFSTLKTAFTVATDVATGWVHTKASWSASCIRFQSSLSNHFHCWVQFASSKVSDTSATVSSSVQSLLWECLLNYLGCLCKCLWICLLQCLRTAPSWIAACIQFIQVASKHCNSFVQLASPKIATATAAVCSWAGSVKLFLEPIARTATNAAYNRLLDCLAAGYHVAHGLLGDSFFRIAFWFVVGTVAYKVHECVSTWRRKRTEKAKEALIMKQIVAEGVKYFADHFIFASELFHCGFAERVTPHHLLAKFDERIRKVHPDKGGDGYEAGSLIHTFTEVKKVFNRAARYSKKQAKRNSSTFSLCGAFWRWLTSWSKSSAAPTIPSLCGAAMVKQLQTKRDAAALQGKHWPSMPILHPTSRTEPCICWTSGPRASTPLPKHWPWSLPKEEAEKPKKSKDEEREQQKKEQERKGPTLLEVYGICQMEWTQELAKAKSVSECKNALEILKEEVLTDEYLGAFLRTGRVDVGDSKPAAVQPAQVEPADVQPAQVEEERIGAMDELD
ncbi:expressed unknown protein [Seminavis robusta]|uniref:J domain-containing protein n=1 Tax=Seminavis robusta TaxID=568900 RepID=A0A9N8DE91_9STRA|nr:expressed unknown protein [Seminavis robusta]|eukprot:Sro108_g054080.1 n/a (616) ;mRNA; r:11536-13383